MPVATGDSRGCRETGRARRLGLLRGGRDEQRPEPAALDRHRALRRHVASGPGLDVRVALAGLHGRRERQPADGRPVQQALRARWLAPDLDLSDVPATKS
jgi:hypothetical protein